MVELFPFQAVRYNPEANLARVIAPPYDQISPRMQEDLYGRDPHNFVRLIFGKILEKDSQTANRYTRAADDLAAWMKQGVLIREEQPCFFAYEQSFSLPNGGRFTRLGLVGLMALEPFGNGVLPHEKTFAKPKEDRLNLMKACKANFEQIFFIYDDPGHAVRKMAANTRLQQPLMTSRDDLGTTHTLWRIAEPGTIKSLQDFFKTKKLLVADGHHRYETSLAYQKEMKEIWCGSTAREAPFNLRLGTFVSLQDPGLLILPTHRVIRGLPDGKIAGLEKLFPEYFEVTQAPSLEDLTAKLGQCKHAFGWITKNQFRLVALKPSFDFDKEFPDTAPPLRGLDVVLLQRLFFDRILALPHDQLDQFVSFVRWPEEALELIQAGSHQMAFLLNPVKPEEVKVVAESGETMPHKSTDFYPKLWSGFVFYKMDI